MTKTFSGKQRTMASIAWQCCIVYGLRRLNDVPGNSDEMACDVAGAGDALRAPSSDAPAGILLEQPADEFEEDGNVDESERTSVIIGEAATGKATTSNVSATSHRQVTDDSAQLPVMFAGIIVKDIVKVAMLVVAQPQSCINILMKLSINVLQSNTERPVYYIFHFLVHNLKAVYYGLV
uniref:Uncharacterized protein n=1 Tax=Oryza rufipogon TaxID=4529 RepID=A0A0E0NKJ7_ORYRU